MRKLMSFSLRHPWPVLVGILAITLAAVSRLDELVINISAVSMMAKDDRGKTFYDETVDTFGADHLTVVVFSDPALLEPETLGLIRKAVVQLESLPFVERAESLFSVNHVENVGGLLSAEPYFAHTAQTPADISRAKAAALNNPLIESNLLSVDATAMAVNLYLEDIGDDPDLRREVVRSIDAVLDPLDDELETTFQIGQAAVRQGITETIRADQRIIIPASVLVLLLSLALTLRTLNSAVLPLLTASLSVIWTLGLMAALEIPVSVMTSLVPALLVIIGSTEDVHLLSEYYGANAAGQGRFTSVKTMSEKMGLVVLLTFITTYLGFLSLSLNNIELLQQFGLIASTGLLFNFVVTVLVVPVYLGYLGETRHAVHTKSRDASYARISQLLSHAVGKRKKTVAALFSVVTAVVGSGVVWVQVTNNPMDYFDPESAIRKQANMVAEQLSGVHTFAVVLDSQIEGTFLKVRYLEELRKLQAHIESNTRLDKSVSFADYMMLIHGVMEDESGGDPTPTMPYADELVTEYMLFVKPDEIRPYVSEDFSRARILVRHNIGPSYELNQVLDELEALARDNIDPGLHVNITGESVLTNRAVDAIAYGQAKSLVLMTVVIFLIVTALFVNVRAGLIATATNVLPIVILFGVMGHSGIPLDMGTAMIAAVSIGICVDHTIHFMVRYHQNLKQSADEPAAIVATLREEVIPMVATSVALSLGFLTMTLSNFPPVVRFGLLSAMVMMLALIATLLITPTLLSLTRLVTVWDMLSLRVRSRVINECRLFRGMRLWQIKKIILLSDVREFDKGELIIRQGESGREMYVVLEGKTQVRVKGADGSVSKTAVLSEGALFGEIAPVANVPRTADVVALEKIKVLVFHLEGVKRIARFLPGLSSKLFLNLASIIGDRLASREA